jgi:hypothetical protein
MARQVRNSFSFDGKPENKINTIQAKIEDDIMEEAHE